MPRDCPNCGDHLPAKKTSCSACGWADAKPVLAQVSAADYGRCEWTHFGDRCRYPGTVSKATSALKHNWFCHGHAFCEDVDLGEKIVRESERAVHAVDYSLTARRSMHSVATPESPQSLQARAAIPGGKGSPGKWWAERILRRLELGEKIPVHVETLARQALNREPPEAA